MLFNTVMLLTADISKETTGIGTLIGAFVMLVLVLILAFFAIKFLSTRGRFAARSKLIKVIDRVPISADTQLVVVSVADETYLLGVTSGGITKLMELDSELCKSILAEKHDIQFLDVLKSAMGKGEGKQ